MSFTEFFIRRPAFTVVITLVLTIFGIIGYSHLAVRWIPDISFPFVSIYTDYPGASASLIETEITTPIEAALAGVDGIETLSSTSKEGKSMVNIEFRLGRNTNAAVEDVRSALQRNTGSLPRDVKMPEIEKADLTGQPILYLAFFDSHRSAQETSNYVKQFILPRLQSVDGVASVQTFGGRDSAMRIWLDPMKMAASNVTVNDINKVLTEQNIEVPSGQIRGVARYYNVVANETLKSAAEFNNLIIRDDQNQAVRLGDVGQAIVDAANLDGIFRVNGEPAVAMGIIPQSTANPLDVAQHISREFSQLSKTLPEGMSGSIVFNQADFIQNSIHHVYTSLLESIVLVLVVIFLFLASWRAAIIPVITIPVCLIATFAVMHLLNISINTVTMMAFVLAIGLVVDDAIVMLENIMRHIEAGMQPFQAAIRGSREIVFPVIAMTITLAAVYAPIAFTSGLLGAVFWEFAITLATAVLFSGVVALTLSPMMSARLLEPAGKQSGYAQKLHQRFAVLRENYQALLRKILTKKTGIVIILICTGIAGCLIYRSLPSELAPAEDMNEIDTNIIAPRDASFLYTDSYVQKLEAIYKTIPDIQTIASEVGFWSPSHSSQFLMLVPREKRSRNAAEITAEINRKIKNISGIDVTVYPETSPLTGFSGDNAGSSIVMQIMSSMDYKSLHTVMERFLAAVRKYPGLTDVSGSLKWDATQFEVTIDREKTADMKISMQEITDTLSTLLAGRTTGHFEYDGNLYDVIVQMNREALSNPGIISQLYVRNLGNVMVPLSGLVSVSEVSSPERLPHFDRLRADTMRASLVPGYTIADAVIALQKIAKEVLPDNVKYAFQGEAKTYLDSSGKMNTMFLLAMIFIYLVLVAQFESFIDPLIILLTVPFAMIGALLMLKLTGGSLNLYSDIALVTLIGLIAKHGILITEFANHLRSEGKTAEEAVIEAANLRLRPILMTTAAMVLGALPLALASGSGSETRHQVGWVVVGGMLLGTFFSLIVVPVAYAWLARFKKPVV